jgi:hypothetical protein
MDKQTLGMADDSIQPGMLPCHSVSGAVLADVRLTFAPRVPAAVALMMTVLSGRCRSGFPVAG